MGKLYHSTQTDSGLLSGKNLPIIYPEICIPIIYPVYPALDPAQQFNQSFKL